MFLERFIDVAGYLIVAGSEPPSEDCYEFPATKDFDEFPESLTLRLPLCFEEKELLIDNDLFVIPNV